MHRPHLTASSFYYEHVGLSKIIGIFYDHCHIVIKHFHRKISICHIRHAYLVVFNFKISWSNLLYPIHHIMLKTCYNVSFTDIHVVTHEFTYI